MFSKKRAFTAAAVAAGAALVLAGCAGGSTGGDSPDSTPTLNPDEKVTLNMSFWGNDVRAGLYDKVIAEFEKQYPNITVNTSFLDFPSYWEKRQTEAAGGGLPDVMQFDYSYLRQYSENGLLLDLNPYLGNIIETDPLPDNILSIGVVGDQTTAIPTSTNAWGLFTNPKLLDTVGVDDFEGGSWDDYTEWMGTVTEAGGGTVYGGSDFTGRIQNFEVQQRAKGKDLFTDDGKANFTEKDLKAFWEQGDAVRDGIGVPAQKTEELKPLGPFDSAVAASELTWDNFGAGYLANLGADYTELNLIAPPVTKEGAKDLYLKPSMLEAVSAKTKHPEAAATLVNFLINSPESGEIFGTNRGLPASETALAAATLDPIAQQIKDYEASITDRLGDAPPVPINGYGTLEQKFLEIGQELGYGTISVDDAVSQFFSEMDTVLNQ